MYEWLSEALAEDGSTVVTANRRLARVLLEVYGQRRIEAGDRAWRRPAIHAHADWLRALLDRASHAADLPVRIGASQSQLLWEECLRKDVDDPLLNISALARLCRDAWIRLHEWRVPLAECRARAGGLDQRIFARAAERYAGALAARDWSDEAQLTDLVAGLIKDAVINAPGRISLAGFDRITPQFERLLGVAGERGSDIVPLPATAPARVVLRRFANPDAELRAAGAWAREILSQAPTRRVAIVVSNLEQDAERSARIVREGFTPGWQYADERVFAAVDVSYGRRLAGFPAIHDALLALGWLWHELPGADVSRLLRSPFFGSAATAGRCRLELRLRDWPDRQWSRELLLRAVASFAEEADVVDWLARFRAAGERLAEGPERRAPAAWAQFADEVLRGLNWPGGGTLSSPDFQLGNRWRELLNEFSRLGLVSAEMTGAAAVARLSSMAADTIFQPEAGGAVVSVLGPLEAAGLEFDHLWIAGLTSTDWPPPGRAPVLLPRDLQREHGMPDAQPADTEAHARKILSRLAGSTADAALSFPATIEDAEQLPTALLADSETADGDSDPGWHAVAFAGADVLADAEDRVPAATPGEALQGGAGTINRYSSDPFATFAHGRLGIRWLPAFTRGIAANVRGNLIHDALRRLYAECPDRDSIRSWGEEVVERRSIAAADAAFLRYERHADAMLRELLRLEKERTVSLLVTVVGIDRQRDAFAIDGVEEQIQDRFGPLTLTLRSDRVDRLADGRLLILDYKTGATKRFLSGGKPADVQLVVYSAVLDEPVAGLALFNVDSKQTAIDGVGPGIDAGDEDFDERLLEWQREVRSAAARIAAGDVRLNVLQSSADARPLALLSRYAEVRRER